MKSALVIASFLFTTAAFSQYGYDYKNGYQDCPCPDSLLLTEPDPPMSNDVHKLYDANQELIMHGQFCMGRLWCGKWYHYDDDGLLIRIDIIKDGEIWGEAPVEDDDY